MWKNSCVSATAPILFSSPCPIAASPDQKLTYWWKSKNFAVSMGKELIFFCFCPHTSSSRMAFTYFSSSLILSSRKSVSYKRQLTGKATTKPCSRRFSSVEGRTFSCPGTASDRRHRTRCSASRQSRSARRWWFGQCRAEIVLYTRASVLEDCTVSVKHYTVGTVRAKIIIFLRPHVFKKLLDTEWWRLYPIIETFSLLDNIAVIFGR